MRKILKTVTESVVLELSEHHLFIRDVRIYCLGVILVEIVCIIHQIFKHKQTIWLIGLKERT